MEPGESMMLRQRRNGSSEVAQPINLLHGRRRRYL